MALTESQETKIEISSNGTVFVDTVTKIMRDSVEVASETNRTGYFPGADISKLPKNIQLICNAAWTVEVIADYQAKVRAQDAIS